MIHITFCVRSFFVILLWFGRRRHRVRRILYLIRTAINPPKEWLKSDGLASSNAITNNDILLVHHLYSDTVFSTVRARRCLEIVCKSQRGNSSFGDRRGARLLFGYRGDARTVPADTAVNAIRPDARESIRWDEVGLG